MRTPSNHDRADYSHCAIPRHGARRSTSFFYLTQDNDTRRWPTLHRSNALFSLRQKDHPYNSPLYIK